MADWQQNTWQWFSVVFGLVVTALSVCWWLRQAWQHVRGYSLQLGRFKASLYKMLGQSSAHRHLCLCCRWLGVTVWALIDSGASHSLVTRQFVRAHCIPTRQGTEFKVRLPDGSQCPGCDYVVCRLKVNSVTISCKLLVVDLALELPVVLGMDWLTAANPSINWAKRTVAVHGSILQGLSPAECKQVLADTTVQECELGSLSYLQAKRAVRHGQTIYMCYAVQVDSDSLATSAPVTPVLSHVDKLKCGQPEIDSLLYEYADVFTEPEGLPPHRPVELHIDLVPGAVPPHRAPYRLGPTELAELKRQLDELLRKGYIQPSCSPYAAPLFFVPKKDGTLRPVCDWRLLNAVTVKARGPIPNIQDLLDAMQGATVWTKFDMVSAYNQMRVHEPDIPKTAFVCRYGQFEWRVAAFGLCNMPAVFQSLMHSIFREYLDEFVVIYLDDIMVFSKTITKHVQHLRLVLEKFRQHRLYLKPSKCLMAQPKVDFLGHIVSRDGLSLDPAKIQALADWPVPTNPHEVRQFLGLCGWFRRFIAGFSGIAAPMHALTGKDAPFVWGPAQQLAFEALKAAIVSAPVLQLFDPHAPTTIHTDASDIALGGVLLQADASGKQHPVAFHSRKLNGAEKNYPIHERELLAVVDCCKVWRYYLESILVLVRVDHEAIR